MDFKEKIKKHNALEYDFVNEVIELALSPSTFKTTMKVTYHEQPFRYP